MELNEFSNEFDVIYNSITSNQAPGLDEYEKSVMLTKAQDQVILSYSNPRANKVQQGFDDSQRRQIDFSSITKTYTLFIEGLKVMYWKNTPAIAGITIVDTINDLYDILNESGVQKSDDGTFDIVNKPIEGLIKGILEANKNTFNIETKEIHDTIRGDLVIATISDTSYNPLFDPRDNSISVRIPSDILSVLNERVFVNGTRKASLTCIPIQFNEYDRLMSKPFKRPLKYQAWRIFNHNKSNRADLVVGIGDTISMYTLRYIRRPRPIILTDLEDGLSIGGLSTQSSCELDPILHSEILQRAVELAKASYSGDLQSQIALGQASQTDIGHIQSR